MKAKKKLMNQKRKRKNDRGMSTATSARMVEMSCAAMDVTKSLIITALASSPNPRAIGSARIAQPRSLPLPRRSKLSSGWVTWATSV